MVLALAALQLGCPGKPDAGAERPTVDRQIVLGRPPSQSDSVRVEVYLDATASMAGYVSDASSNYVRFLDELEASVQTAWKRADIHFYKFGRRSREIDRAAFLAARTAPFYAEAGMSEITGIDQVIRCGTPATVSIVVTDLFQSEGDVNAIVSQIKQQCFQQGVSVGVLGVRSQFDGTVYDARVPAYRLTTTADSTTFRPFYALMFGEGGDLDRLFQSLRNVPFVNDRDFVLVSNTVMRDYTVAMSKPPRSRELNVRRAAPDAYEFSFDLLKGAGPATMLADVTLTPNPNAPPFRADQLTLEAYRRAGARGRTDSVATRDVTLQSVTMQDGRLRATLGLTIGDPPGEYSYELVLRTGAINGFTVPAWVEEFSSDNPTPRADANRTLNLAKFVSDLRRAASSVQQPAVAKWYVNVRKL